MNYYIKYGNLLYLADRDGLWSHQREDADVFSLHEVKVTLIHLHQDTGLYEARIVPESDIAITVENVP